jgi:hypothetical protein
MKNNMSNNKQQTAVEWLIEQLTPVITLQQKHIDVIKSIAKEMEKEQSDKPLDERLFNLANEFAVAGYGYVAVRLHSIHNEFLKYKDERIRR